MSDETRQPDNAEVIPEPEVIQEARGIIEELKKEVDSGEVEAVSVYIENRDGGYRTLQAGSPSRHEDAGRILEMALLRLGFVQAYQVQRMIDEALG